MLNKLINTTSIRSQLFITVASGIFLLLAAQIYSSTLVSDRQTQKLLRQQGLNATIKLASDSRLALLYDSIENAGDSIRTTLAFSDVVSIHIYRDDASLFYCSLKDNNTGRAEDKHELRQSDLNHVTQAQLFQDEADYWVFIAPVSTRSATKQIEQQIFNSAQVRQDSRIGYVMVSISKNSVNTLARNILISNLLVALPVGILILLLLRLIITRLTQPLRRLTDIMNQTEQGDHASAISIQGPKEVHTIANAYNRMVAALAERDEKLREHNLHLEKQALHDHLTGLTNRIGFEQGLRIALEECRALHATHVLCYLDLDRFKAVNDTCGHNAGDELLKNISDIFHQHIRKDADLLARIGGDEFALILKNCSLAKARSIGEQICSAVADYSYECKGKQFRVGVSIGIIPLDDEAGDFSEITARVDSACYAAKAAGRGQVFVLHKDQQPPQRSAEDRD